MTKISLVLAAISAWFASAHPGLTQQSSPQHGTPGVERLYVLYCGDIALTDASSFTPGASGPGALSDTCYLIKHAQGWVLWDTGLPDSLVAMPEGMKSNAGVWTSKKTLASQLAALDLKPSDIRYLALSHSHPDHVAISTCFRRPPWWCKRPSMIGCSRSAARASSRSSRPSRRKATGICSATAAWC
jgi:hypothetical protein